MCLGAWLSCVETLMILGQSLLGASLADGSREWAACGAKHYLSPHPCPRDGPSKYGMHQGDNGDDDDGDGDDEKEYDDMYL